ncbi:MAG: DUF998 domain-containing protein [Candidatus Freyarchaeota archaeon]|nr:DUF998 domain-containing protein [Candidatus Jordarchaeia archaeon]MBS7269400.1 DUF998 domain-containing protein [Candidatus Jordarchaeia archaeon]
MEKSVEINPKMTLIGGVLAVAAMTFTVIFISTSVIFYTISPWRPLFFWYFIFPIPNTGYSIPNQFLSELGVGPTATIYNYGLIITGAVCIPIFPIVCILLRKTITARLAAIFGIAGCIVLIGVGIYPMHIPVLHGLFSFAFFALIGLAIITASIAMYKGEFFTKHTTQLGIVVIVADIILGILGNPISEWGTTILFIIWVYAVGIQMLLKRKTTQI